MEWYLLDEKALWCLYFLTCCFYFKRFIIRIWILKSIIAAGCLKREVCTSLDLMFHELKYDHAAKWFTLIRNCQNTHLSSIDLPYYPGLKLWRHPHIMSYYFTWNGQNLHWYKSYYVAVWNHTENKTDNHLSGDSDDLLWFIWLQSIWVFLCTKTHTLNLKTKRREVQSSLKKKIMYRYSESGKAIIAIWCLN